MTKLTSIAIAIDVEAKYKKKVVNVHSMQDSELNSHSIYDHIEFIFLKNIKYRTIMK